MSRINNHLGSRDPVQLNLIGAVAALVSCQQLQKERLKDPIMTSELNSYQISKISLIQVWPLSLAL